MHTDQILCHARFAKAIRRLLDDSVKMKIFSIFRCAHKIGDVFWMFVKVWNSTGELPNFFLAKIVRRSLLLVTERDRYSIIKLEWRNDKHAIDIINLYLILQSKAFWDILQIIFNWSIQLSYYFNYSVFNNYN